VDAILAAGDICEGLARAVEALRRAYPEPLEIVMVPGNHEFHSRKLSYADNLAQGREAAELHRVRLLERDVCYLGKSVRIIGCTMWTNYSLFGEDLREAAMRIAAATMNDHRRIAWQRKPWHRFRPQEAYALHLYSRAIVECELATPHVGPTICVFHHAVIPEVMETARRDLLDAAYASDLTVLFESFPCELVVTGHVHRSFDVRRGSTRFLANPAGYAGENASFDPALVVEVPNG
jgi:DNA repair exonuclease SbcCD nuclease subunit